MIEKMTKNVIDRGCWTSWSEIQLSLYAGEQSIRFLNYLKMAFNAAPKGIFKNARVCYSNKTMELHVDKHGNIVYRCYEVS